MILLAVATAAIGVLQLIIDKDTSMLVSNVMRESDLNHKTRLEFESSSELVCDQNNSSKCVSAAWHLLPYFLLTCGEILFSISGLNLAYQEVGKLTKASATSLWLFTVAIGNLAV